MRWKWCSAANAGLWRVLTCRQLEDNGEKGKRNSIWGRKKTDKPKPKGKLPSGAVTPTITYNLLATSYQTTTYCLPPTIYYLLPTTYYTTTH